MTNPMANGPMFEPDGKMISELEHQILERLVEWLMVDPNAGFKFEMLKRRALHQVEVTPKSMRRTRLMPVRDEWLTKLSNR